jgi:hypothetical protein
VCAAFLVCDSERAAYTRSLDAGRMPHGWTAHRIVWGAGCRDCVRVFFIHSLSLYNSTSWIQDTWSIHTPHLVRVVKNLSNKTLISSLIRPLQNSCLTLRYLTTYN